MRVAVAFGLVVVVAVLVQAQQQQQKQRPPYLHAPAVEAYAKHDPQGVTILPNGRQLTPAGASYALARFPHGMAMSRDGRMLFIASDSVGQIVTGWQGGGGAAPEIREWRLPQPDPKKRSHLNAGGAEFSPDGSLLYWSSGETGLIGIFETASGKRVGEIALNVPVAKRKFEDSYAADLKLSADGRYLYAADVTNFRLVIADTAERRVIGSTPVGRYPYALAISGDRVFVANIGLFEYQAIPEPADGKSDKRGITRPAFGYPSKEARDGVRFEGRKVPGLGKDNLPQSFSVTSVDVANPRAPKAVAYWKTGLMLQSPSDNGVTVGGSAPNFLAVHGDSLYVSNGNNDLIERLDLKSGKVLARQRLTPSPLVAKWRGVGPSGMALTADGSRLYVAESGINAVAVLDGRTLAVQGHVPTAWYPYRVAVSPDGKRLASIAFKGFGNGPNAGAAVPKSPFLGLKGALTLTDVPGDLGEMTAKVLANNGMVDASADRAAMSTPLIPGIPGEASKEIRYVVFITKENHTFDTIFDRVPGAKHDPSLLRWGLHQTIKGDKQPTLEDVAVMTNHNSLARAFTVSDNFYMEPEASGVGHRWLVGVQPNNLMQMTYSLGWNFKKNSTAPGRRYSMGSNGSLIPEDYPEAGSMWEHLGRNGVTFRNYGEGFEFPGVVEGEDEHPTGAREVVNIPMPKVLFDNTAFGYPIFNMNIPDQYRAHWFMQDVERNFLPGSAGAAEKGKRRGAAAVKKPFPQFLNIAICNDHGAAPKPDKGYPYLASWMADNDLALGRIVEFLSHTPYWKNMAIFVTEDDSGGEPDHVDAQRSVLLVISPWAKRGYVSHRHTTILSMHRTLYEIFGLAPLNQFDALANNFADCFTDQPDFTPYTVTPVDARIFDPEKAKDPKDPDYGKARKLRSIKMDDDDEMEEILKRGARENSTKKPK